MKWHHFVIYLSNDPRIIHNIMLWRYWEDT